MKQTYERQALEAVILVLAVTAILIIGIKLTDLLYLLWRPWQ